MAYLVTSLNPSKFIAIDEVDANTTYIGFAKAGTGASVARWQVRKIVKTGNVTLFQFADGNELYDNVWDNRLTLSYS